MLLNQLQTLVLLLEKRFTPISELNWASGALDFAKLTPLFQVVCGFDYVGWTRFTFEAEGEWSGGEWNPKSQGTAGYRHNIPMERGSFVKISRSPNPFLVAPSFVISGDNNIGQI